MISRGYPYGDPLFAPLRFERGGAFLSGGLIDIPIDTHFKAESSILFANVKGGRGVSKTTFRIEMGGTARCRV